MSNINSHYSSNNKKSRDGKCKMKKLTQFLSIVVLLIFLDRIVKEIVLANLTNTIVIIPKLLTIQFPIVYNNGIAFGLFNGMPYVIEALTGLIILSSLYALPRVPKKYITAMAIIIGGAAGNFIDRIIYEKGVVDFIAVRYFSVFNIADIAITVGVIWMITIMFLEEKTQKSTGKKRSAKKKTRRKKK